MPDEMCDLCKHDKREPFSQLCESCGDMIKRLLWVQSRIEDLEAQQQKLKKEAVKK